MIGFQRLIPLQTSRRPKPSSQERCTPSNAFSTKCCSLSRQCGSRSLGTGTAFPDRKRTSTPTKFDIKPVMFSARRTRYLHLRSRMNGPVNLIPVKDGFAKSVTLAAYERPNLSAVKRAAPVARGPSGLAPGAADDLIAKEMERWSSGNSTAYPGQVYYVTSYLDLQCLHRNG